MQSVTESRAGYGHKVPGKLRELTCVGCPANELAALSIQSHIAVILHRMPWFHLKRSCMQ